MPVPAAAAASSSSSQSIDPRRLVQLHEERVSHVSSTDYPGHYPGEAHTWDLQRFRRNLKLDIKRVAPSTIDFDLVGVDASIANAFRRILIANVETVAVEKVFIWQNTSVIHDEVLSQRLGLVPLRVKSDYLDTWDPNGPTTDRNTIAFNLQASCERRDDYKRGETDPEKLYSGSNVYASQMIWDPQGDQATKWAHDPPRVAAPDILLAKLRPGQEINLQMHCYKSNGRDHAKFSPVATATYRLMPHIDILRPIPPHLCDKFKSCFADGVIELQRSREGVKAVVKEPRKDTVSREVLRHPEFEGMVKLNRVRDHFLFTIESVGQIDPQELFPMAVGVMRAKIRTVKAALELMMSAPMDVDEP